MSEPIVISGALTGVYETPKQVATDAREKAAINMQRIKDRLLLEMYGNAFYGDEDDDVV